MKKSLLTVLFGTTFSTALLAQPTLVISDVIPVFGSTQIIAVSNYMDPGPGGANQVWDFSNLSATNQQEQLTEMPSEAPDSDNFPDATHVGISGQGGVAVYSYARYADNKAELVAITSPLSGVEYHYVDHRSQLEFPITFGSTFTDTYNRVDDLQIPGFESGENGTVLVTVDGYGTLITPSGTFTDVLRVHYEVNSVITSTNFGEVSPEVPFTESTYAFIKAGYAYSLLSMSSSEFNGQAAESGTYLIGDDALAIDDLPPGISSLMVFPNPAKDAFSVQFGIAGSEMLSMSLTSLDGKLVKQFGLFNLSGALITISADIVGLPSGFYVLNMDFGHSSVSRKLVVR